MKSIYLLAIILMFALGVHAQQKTEAGGDHKNMSHADCPMMQKSGPQTSEKSKDPNRHDMVMKNGEKAMGFSQTETTHHFLIMNDGGAIQVEANDARDTANRDKVRGHLKEIARQFQKGIYTTPAAVHGQVPPGVPEMEQLKDRITYTYEETGNGGRVRITATDPNAVAAVHVFLKFQIDDHKTGDPTH